MSNTGLFATSAVERETREALEAVARRLTAADAPAAAAEALSGLAGQVGQPCVVAVVGQVNAGKSTFINALLGEDRALVGTTETTATINHFVYGEPDPEHPVRCHWRAGRVTLETPEFLDSLQGRDPAALERADGIDRLEYLLPNPILRSLTLVDTPGTTAAIAKHEDRTVDFLDVAKRLRERHDEETRRIHDRADAIIYLVGAVARAGDKELLEGFAGAGADRARAMNAIGVIARVDLSDELLSHRHELAGKIADQLRAQLNAVVPVSAALARAADGLSAAPDRLQALVDAIRRIPAGQLKVLLENEDLFRGPHMPDCPVGVAERDALVRETGAPWRVFVAISREVRRDDAPPAEILARLRSLAGLEELARTLSEHFLERAQILRCYGLVGAARTVLKQLWFRDVVRLLRTSRAEEQRLVRFLAFVDQARGDPEVGVELRSYLSARLDRVRQRVGMEAAWQQADADLVALEWRLGEYNADFAALVELGRATDAFSAEEATELRALFGLHGTDAGRRLRGEVALRECQDRQIRWRLTRDASRPGSARWVVADRAHARLGLIIGELRGGEQVTALRAGFR